MRAKLRNYLDYSFFFRNFGFAEVTFTRKNSNKFGFSLIFSYLCKNLQDFFK